MQPCSRKDWLSQAAYHQRAGKLPGWGPPTSRQQTSPLSYLSKSVAYLAGTARFEPPKPLSAAKFMPITLPSLLKSGPPEPPDAVAASYTILSLRTSPICPCVVVGRMSFCEAIRDMT